MKDFKVYTDGSFDRTTGRCTSAYIVTMKNEVMFCGKLNIVTPAYKESWNVSAELMAVLAAVNTIGSLFGKEEQMSVTILHDYVGVANYVSGPKPWVARKRIPILYTQGINEFKSSYPNVSLKFQKVKAHSGVVFNEMADTLANEKIPVGCEGKILSDITL